MYPTAVGLKVKKTGTKREKVRQITNVFDEHQQSARTENAPDFRKESVAGVLVPNFMCSEDHKYGVQGT